MSEIIKRPISVWLTQGLLLFFGFLFLAGFISALIGVFRMPSDSSGGMGILNWLGIAGTILLLLAIIAFIGFTFYSLVKRKPNGRWLGVACLSLFFLMSVYGQITQPQPQYNSSQEKMAGIFTIVIIHGLLLTLIITLIRSEQVAKFFKPEQVETPEQSDAENV